jgi:hypothetical protein
MQDSDGQYNMQVITVLETQTFKNLTLFTTSPDNVTATFFIAFSVMSSDYLSFTVTPSYVLLLQTVRG